MLNRLKESSEECTESVFWSVSPAEDALVFVFACRAEEWLRAEGIIHKRRRQRGKQEPAEDPEVKSLPKPDPAEEVAPTGGAETLSTTAFPPQPQSPTPLSYADEEPAAQHGGMALPTSQPTGQEEQQPTQSVFIPELQRPRKIPRRSLRNFTFTADDETKPTVTGAHSIHQAPAEGGPGPKIKIEEDGLVSKFNAEGDPTPKIKEEMGRSN